MPAPDQNPRSPKRESEQVKTRFYNSANPTFTTLQIATTGKSQEQKENVESPAESRHMSRDMCQCTEEHNAVQICKMAMWQVHRVLQSEESKPGPT